MATIRKKRQHPGKTAALLAVLFAAGLSITSACGDDTVEPVPPPAPVPTTITISPASATLQSLGETVRLAATVQDQNGQTMSGATVAWASGDPSVATVDASGLVTAAANGTATVTATAGSASASTAVTVDQVLAAVAVEPATDTLLAFGDTLRLSAEAVDANGHAVAGTEFAWASGDTSVATVDASGLVTGMGSGTATVTASAGSTSGAATVTVQQAVAEVVVEPANDTLLAFGDTLRLSAEAVDANGHSVTGAEFAWESGDTSVATVDASGLVTGVGSGTATVTASAGSTSGAAAVTVQQAVAGVVVEPANDTLLAFGDTLRLSAEAVDANGHAVAGTEFAWASGDTSVATVDASGLVTGAGSGTATVTASAGSASGAAAVTVRQAVAEVVVEPATDTLLAFGDTLRLSAEAVDANGHSVTGAEFAWESGDTSVATVDASGLVTGVGSGTATVTASAGSTSGAAAVTVQQAVAGVVVEPANDTLLAFGDTLRLSAEAVDANGHAVAGTEFAWASGDTSVATVDASGLVTGAGSGTATVTASAGSASGAAAVTVRQAVAEVVVEPATDTLLAFGDTLRLSAEAVDANGHSVTGAEFAWASGDPSVATVDASGLVTGVSAGGVEIAAISADVAGRAQLIVVLPAPTTVVVSRDTVELNGIGRKTRLTAEVRDQAGRAMEDAPVLWTSSDTLVATVDQTGLVTAMGIGAAIITAKADSAFGTALVTVRPPLSDREVLAVLYNKTDGPNWVNSDNWLTAAPLKTWYGVETDKSGRVVSLELSGRRVPGASYVPHGLAGPIPPELGDLTNLRQLDFGRNHLSGEIPRELGSLANLEGLALYGNKLSGAIPPELGDLAKLRWLMLSSNKLSGEIPMELGSLGNLGHLNLNFNNLSGPIPPELGDLASLRYLYLSYNDLSGGIPPELSNLTNLERLEVLVSQLSGEIPPELGRLANLRFLVLVGSDLTGEIPPELGNLANLEQMHLFGNRLSGSIPPELGNLPNLEQLTLRFNRLSGTIPLALANLAKLTRLDLTNNRLSGTIPPALGRLTNLGDLDLSSNGLSGMIPPELGDLANLEDLLLSNNRLSGSVPSRFGGLASLRRLELSNNDDLAGALPASLTHLRLESLQAANTDLCAPSDPAFQAWLRTIAKQSIAPCDLAMAYLVQAVQSRTYPVPLVAGEAALLRVFVTAQQPTSEDLPHVRAKFFLGGTERHVVDIAAKSTAIPSEVEEGDLLKSANAEIPGWLVAPGLEMVIEIDPDSTLDPGLGVPKRIPETGRLPIRVEDTPVLDLTVIPFLWSAAPDSGVIAATEGMRDDPDGHALLEDTRILLPVRELDVTAHDPVASTSNDVWDLLEQTNAVRALEGAEGHHMGMMSGPVTGAGGVAFIGGRTSVSTLNPKTVAHELGHNMSLQHAPCGGASGPDPLFPDPNGQIGAWGYDFRNGLLVPPHRPDLMGYCGPHWISGYHFTNALAHRLADEGSAPAVATAPARSLLLWGGVDADGEPFLNPAFAVEAPAALPDSAGDYTLTGRDASGSEIFSLSFAMPELAPGDGRSSFAFVLPVLPEGAGGLASITLSGPNGMVTLDGDTDRPMAILRNPRTRQVRAFLRDVPAAAQAAMGTAGQAAQPGVEVLFSRGLPDPSAWRP